MFLQRVGNRGIRLGTIFDRAAKRSPANMVVLDHDLAIAPGLGRRATVTELASLIDDIAARLWAARVRPGERAVVYRSDTFDSTLLACAIARVGAVPVLLSPQLDGATVAQLIQRVGRPTLISDQQKLEQELSDEVFELTSGVLLTAGSHPNAKNLSELAGAARVSPVIMPAEHPALITHTSGTTGTPKLAVHTGYSLQSRYRPQAAVASLVAQREPVAIHVSFVHSRMFTAMPIALLQGHPLIIMADDHPDSVAEVFRQAPPGLIEAHPNSFMRWEVLAEHPARPLAKVRFFSSTFDAIHPRTVNTLLTASERRRPLFMQMYGQSEVGPITGRTYDRRWGREADGRCVGWPFPGMTSVRLVPRDGQPPSRTSPGYIEVRTEGRIQTYLAEDERYRRQVSDGWWRMGDVGYRTPQGCLHLMDREIDQIPGIASTLAIEDMLFARLDELAEVIIVPGPNGVPVPVVCTRDDKPLDQSAWQAAVVGLPTLAEPVQWRLADLPQTATTKIKRVELARLLLNGRQA
jgi:acyl-coenzyme A synthetase/AMP-(fatty) acid ligase